MALAMARPWKHPKTGIYWLRKRVPDDLQPLVGTKEIRRSLQTRDPADAKRRLLSALAELETRWANLRVGPRTLTEVDAHELARSVCYKWFESHRENPSDQIFWRTDLYDRLFTQPDFSKLGLSSIQADSQNPYLIRDPDASAILEMERWCSAGSRELLASLGMDVDEQGQRRLSKAVAAAVQRASLALSRLARGEVVDNPAKIATVSSRTPANASAVSNGMAPEVKFSVLVDGWAAEKRPAKKTLYEWKRVVRQLTDYLGHDDAIRVLDDDLIAWKNSMVEAGLRPKTIRDAKIAPIRAILQWGVDNNKLPANSAKRVVIDVKTKTAESKRSFSDEEAAKILRAALDEKSPAKRWVPWLCAYSGARIAEICQLRTVDIAEIDGVWCLKIDPEAGPLKTRGSERIIPLHPAVLEMGFLDFVRDIPSGPLFPELRPDKFGSRGGNGTKVIGRWVRSLGLTDPRLSPNHSWRHRLKTLSRRHGLALDIVDAITGHSRKTVADGYGEFPVSALFRELTKIPKLDVSD